mgnify:CR=1 FL=1|jgi:hypothetical protein|tara:strand:- start:99 stop:254 length:156 start_codon:yes stop_codon:yes gene_type:complete
MLVFFVAVKVIQRRVKMSFGWSFMETKKEMYLFRVYDVARIFLMHHCAWWS